MSTYAGVPLILLALLPSGTLRGTSHRLAPLAFGHLMDRQVYRYTIQNACQA
jgi:hypothetical protein